MRAVAAHGGPYAAPLPVIVSEPLAIFTVAPLTIDPPLTVPDPRNVPPLASVHNEKSVIVSVAAAVHDNALFVAFDPEAALANVHDCLVLVVAMLVVPAAPGSPVWSCTQTVPVYSVSRALLIFACAIPVAIRRVSPPLGCGGHVR